MSKPASVHFSTILVSLAGSGPLANTRLHAHQLDSREAAALRAGDRTSPPLPPAPPQPHRAACSTPPAASTLTATSWSRQQQSENASDESICLEWTAGTVQPVDLFGAAGGLAAITLRLRQAATPGRYAATTRIYPGRCVCAHRAWW